MELSGLLSPLPASYVTPPTDVDGTKKLGDEEYLILPGELWE